MTGAPFVNIGAALPLRYMTRHAGIFGATGTGKTTTAGAVLEGLAGSGVPVLILDAKGDLESLTRAPGGRMWDCTGRRGMPRRLDLSRMGPDLMARALDLSEAQAGALEIAHAFTTSRGLPLHSLADLRAALGLVTLNADALSLEFGLVTPSSVAAVQRALLRLDRAAPDAFGIPALDPFNADRRDRQGRGAFTVLRGAPFMNTPGLYGAAAAHILETLYRDAGELGETPAPALAVFLDESHLIFQDAPRAVVQRLESVVRLIRSKGVALIFATQSPADLPPAISGQLATRIQHGLRGSTRQGLSEIRAAADTMPTKGGVDAFEAIKALGTGEALVSIPGAGGEPQPAKRIRIQAGAVRLEPLRDSELPKASIFPDAPPPISLTPCRPTIWGRMRQALPRFG